MGKADISLRKVASAALDPRSASLRSAPALVIADVMMPEMDGEELCRRIKGDPALQFVPVQRTTPDKRIAYLETNFLFAPRTASSTLDFTSSAKSSI